MNMFNRTISFLKITTLSLFVLVLSQNSSSQTNDVSKKLIGLDQTIEKILKDWNVPGCGIGIVVKDKLVFARGYGYRDLEKRLPVTPNTLFQIASNTKLFTATAVGLLTIWDMTKQYEKDAEGQYPSTIIENIRVVRKVKESRPKRGLRK